MLMRTDAVVLQFDQINFQQSLYLVAVIAATVNIWIQSFDL